MKTINAAILGAGGMGLRHGKNLKEIDCVNIISVCDTDASRVKKHADELGTKAYTDFDEMLNQEQLDVLYICLPPFAHSGQFEKAARKGINIFIEKPIALDTKRGQSMVQAAQEAGIKTHVGFHMRYGTAVQKLKEMIDSGKAGRPVLFNGRYQCNSLHSTWWRDVDKCGGQIFEQAIHIYDMCRFMFGNPAAISGLMGNVCHAAVPGYTVEDVSATITSFSTGAIASITATNCGVPGRWDGYFDIFYENVSVFFKNQEEAEFHYIKDGSETVEMFSETSNPYLMADEDFIDIIKNDKECSVSIEEGLKSLYYVESAVTSAKLNGKKVIVGK